jgi:predicted  nucleic acid-binding Zn-ribbon protein
MEALLILQDRDKKLIGLRDELERIPRDEERARTRLDDDKNRVETAHTALQETEVEIAKVELDAETRRTTIERLKKQQFETRKNDEYQALAHEVTRYSEQIDALETRELELMEQADGCRNAQEEAKQALDRTQALVDEELAELAKRKESISERVRELEEERVGLAAKVSEEVLSLYERLLKSKGGTALSSVTEAGQCTGCHMKLIPATLIRVHTGKEIAQCENCARILHQES